MENPTPDQGLSVAADDRTVFRPDDDKWVGWQPGGDAQWFSHDEMVQYYPEVLQRWIDLTQEPL